AVYAQLENDPLVLVLPDTILAVLPKIQFAFRDQVVLRLSPAEFRKLIITRGGRTDELEPDNSGTAKRRRMRKPIDAPPATRSVTGALTVLSTLRADGFASDSKEDKKRFGLDNPTLEVSWETDRAHRLVVGDVLPHSATYYASLDHEPYVFTLKGMTLKPFE